MYCFCAAWYHDLDVSLLEHTKSIFMCWHFTILFIFAMFVSKNLTDLQGVLAKFH